MTQTDAATRTLWGRRVLRLVVCWAVTWVLAFWLRLRPEPWGLFAAVAALFAVGWWIVDRRSGWEPVSWAGDPAGRRLRTSSDSRINRLRRLLDECTSRGHHGDRDRSLESLQAILRDVTLDRLRARATTTGVATVPDDDALLAGTDPKLAQYLRAQPPPAVSRQAVTDIIERIEAL